MKKLKNITLKQVKTICEKAQKMGGCTECPFLELKFSKYHVCFCPFETKLPTELENVKIKKVF